MAIYNDDSWSVGEFKANGKPFIVRFREKMPSVSDQKLFQKLIIIVWPYSSNESGMPQSEEFEKMKAFEIALESGTEKNLKGVLAVSITGDGRKEWRYYASDPKEFMNSMNEDLKGHEVYPLEIEMFEDLEWNALSEFIDQYKN